jgi:hypothetical protein
VEATVVQGDVELLRRHRRRSNKSDKHKLQPRWRPIHRFFESLFKCRSAYRTVRYLHKSEIFSAIYGSAAGRSRASVRSGSRPINHAVCFAENRHKTKPHNTRSHVDHSASSAGHRNA